MGGYAPFSADMKCISGRKIPLPSKTSVFYNSVSQDAIADIQVVSSTNTQIIVENFLWHQTWVKLFCAPTPVQNPLLSLVLACHRQKQVFLGTHDRGFVLFGMSQTRQQLEDEEKMKK